MCYPLEKGTYMKIEPEKEPIKTVIIPEERYSTIIAGGVITLFLVATIGFFIGHHVAVMRFLHKVDEEAFSDKILYALYNINGVEQEEESLEEATETKNAVEVEVIQEVVETGDIPQEDNEETTQSLDEKIETDVQPVTASIEEVVYAAPLIGFGTLHAAEQFVEKLNQRNITVIIKHRSSTTNRGRKIRWYQVVTPEYASKKDLEDLIREIQKKEKLQNVTIIEKRKVNN